MVRFGLLAVLGLLLAFVGWALFRHGLGRPPEKPQQAQQRTIANPPSFVVIVGDDVGYGDLGCYGQKHITTPQIDRLAKDGIRLTSIQRLSPSSLNERRDTRSVAYGGQRLWQNATENFTRLAFRQTCDSRDDLQRVV